MTLNYPQKENGMYIIQRPEMDDIATMVLREYAPSALECPQPVKIAAIVEDGLYLTLKYQHISLNNEILGLTAFGDTKFPCYDELLRSVEIDIPEGTVLINSGISGDAHLPRRRFTIAHESSHWILHRSFHSPTNKQYQFRKHKNVLIACRDSNIERERFRQDIKTEEDWEEWQADGLAASLLMPKSTFSSAASRIIQECTGASHLTSEPRNSRYCESLGKIAKIFTVSNKAAEIRLKQLGFIKNTRATSHW